MMRTLPTGAEWWRLVLIVLGQVLLVRWALTLVTPEEGIALMWLPSGYLLGCLVLLPLRLWPWLLGLLLPTVYALEWLTTDRPLSMILGFALANLVESLGGALLFRRFCGGREGFQTYAQLSAFLVWCVLLVPALSALLATWTVVAHTGAEDGAHVYRTWHVSASFGVLCVTPLVVLGARWLREAGWRARSEMQRLGLILMLMAVLVGGSAWLGSDLGYVPPVLICLPLLTWAAISTGLLGGVMVSALLVISALQLTALGVAPFAHTGGTSFESALELQSQFGTVLVATLFMALAVEKYRALLKTLSETSARYRAIFDYSPVSLWEEDFSAVREYLETRTRNGVAQMGEWLRVHPEAVIECARRIQVLSVNAQALEMFAARSEAELSANLHQVFGDEALDVLCEEVIALWEGRTEFVSEACLYTLERQPLDVLVHVSIAPGHERDWQRVLVSVVDLSERKRVQDMLDTFFEQPMTLNLIAGLDGVIRRVNANWVNLLGRTRAELEGHQFLDLIHPEDFEAARIEFSRLCAGGYVTNYIENRCRHRDGSYRLLTWSAAVSPTQGLIYAVATDITGRRAAEEQLRQAAAVVASTAEGVVVTDLDGVILDVNPAFVSITGYGREEVLGKTPKLLSSGRQDAAFYQAMWQALERRGQWRGELWNRHKNGTHYPQLLTISVVRDGDERARGYVGIFTDISSLKRTEERLEQLAHHDALTSLPNRLMLDIRLQRGIHRAARHGSMLAVVFVDLDRFKHLNDSLGHAAGDELLCQVANRLTEIVRLNDTVARLSGDEFVLVLEDIDTPEQARHVLEKLTLVFRQPFALQHGQVYMSASLGVSLYPGDGEDPQTLLRNADAAMYRAKDEGRNTYAFYTAELTAAAFETMFIENALRGALSAGELSLVYQSQFNLDSGALCGMEVLLRWRHPEQGPISPVRFIPVAEQSGLIREIGAWVLASACTQGQRWLDQGLDIGRLAVNVAGPQIQHEDFADMVERTLQETGFPPQYLSLEVTEGFVMRRIDAAIVQLERLRALGIEIAIDDFGTGYASLGYLKKLPIDKLKIDQSFVRDIPDDPDDMAITEAIIVMARALGIDVLAEGVETRAQVAFLHEKGCGEVQGYFYAQPLPAQDVEQTLRLAPRDAARERLV